MGGGGGGGAVLVNTGGGGWKRVGVGVNVGAVVPVGVGGFGVNDGRGGQKPPQVSFPDNNTGLSSRSMDALPPVCKSFRLLLFLPINLHWP